MVRRPRSRGGFALVTAVVFGAAVAIVVASCVGYVAQGARFTRIYVAKDRCRLAAQSAIEIAKAEVQARFSAYVGASGTTVKVDPKSADAYNWFDHVSADRRTIGIADKKGRTGPLTLPEFAPGSGGMCGCSVAVRIGRTVDHRASTSVAKVPVTATATYEYPDGLKVSATIQEYVCFATGQSAVFDYAYFVNNYGWMNGSSICINGDMRANGDVSLTSSTVNGFVYAAENDEVGASGAVTLKSSPRIRSVSQYRQYATSRSRPDAGEDFYASSSAAYDAPKSGGTITASTEADRSGRTIVNAQTDPVPMPFVSDLDSYVEYARENEGTLRCPAYSYTDSAGTVHNVAAKTVNAHFEGDGPSGDASLADKGAVVLVGTQSDPIVVNGPVVVDSDVIITGYVKGQGTIYSGRNVHIIGDVKYLDAPSWSHSNTDTAATAKSNSEKDLLGLVAKGNIIVGDSSDSAWLKSVGSYIEAGRSTSVVNAYECDPSDAAIGYPAAFDGKYNMEETVTGLSDKYAEVADTCGGWDPASGHFGKVRTAELDTTHTETQAVYDRWGRLTGYTSVQVHDVALATEYNRKYYETVCDDAVMQSLKTSSGISQIDAVLYNNHGIFGTPGRSGYTFNLNGSLVCRDEALIFSGSGINFNWDMRLKRNTDSSVADLGLPVGPQEPFTVAWQEVPASLNPANDGTEAGE